MEEILAWLTQKTKEPKCNKGHLLLGGGGGGGGRGRSNYEHASASAIALWISQYWFVTRKNYFSMKQNQWAASFRTKIGLKANSRVWDNFWQVQYIYCSIYHEVVKFLKEINANINDMGNDKLRVVSYEMWVAILRKLIYELRVPNSPSCISNATPLTIMSLTHYYVFSW